MIHLLVLLLCPTIASAFMANPSLSRRTSSVAYDDKSHGPKYSASSGDAWRKRMNLPPFLSNSSTSLSSSPISEDCSGNPMFSFGILTDIQYAPIPDGELLFW
jgi:hypothetical protein